MHSIEKYNEMGRELGERFAPGHLVWVTTHTDKDHVHNHITICSIHSETGKALDHRKADLLRLMEINNDISKKNGLAIIERRTKDHLANLPDGVRKILARGGQSWVLDMAAKIDFARTASTGFDEYAGQLKTLGVDVQVENKNISYFYGDHKKAVRGKTLGPQFDKEGLMKAFKENDEKFAKYPGLREQIRADIGAAFDGKGNSLGAPSHLLLESVSHSGLRKKDYSKFTKIERGGHKPELPAIFDERGGVLYQEMKRAQGMSIFDYCAKNKIQTKTNEKGQTVLAGREFVVLNDKGWTNTKNRTKGTIIDFVAAHEETTYLRAVAKINNNPKLLILEQVMGEYKKGYQPFYVPKPKAASPEKAATTLKKFFNSRGIKGEAERTLLESRSFHVGHDASVWLMNEKGDTALEFREEKSGQWKSKRHGNPVGIFMEVVGKAKQAVIYRDPFEFAVFSANRGSPVPGQSFLVMMGEGGSDRRIDEFLVIHSHITEVHLAQSGRPESQKQEERLFRDMKRKFNPFDIQIKELTLSSLGKERGRGPDISF